MLSLACQQHHFIARCPMHVKARNILPISDLQPLSTMVSEVLPLMLVESKAIHIIQYSFQENVQIQKCLFVIKSNHLLCLSSKIVGKTYLWQLSLLFFLPARLQKKKIWHMKKEFHFTSLISSLDWEKVNRITHM